MSGASGYMSAKLRFFSAQTQIGPALTFGHYCYESTGTRRNQRCLWSPIDSETIGLLPSISAGLADLYHEKSVIARQIDQVAVKLVD
jgi:hypothetical protein